MTHIHFISCADCVATIIFTVVREFAKMCTYIVYKNVLASGKLRHRQNAVRCVFGKCLGAVHGKV